MKTTGELRFYDGPTPHMIGRITSDGTKEVLDPAYEWNAGAQTFVKRPAQSETRP